jgi:polyisoprenyl-phosphate glycosyltransferase
MATTLENPRGCKADPMSSTRGSEMTRTLWLVVPVYFDVPAFEVLRRRLLDQAATVEELAGAEVRLVVVDDSAGRDPELAALTKLEDVEVVTPPYNLGHQRTLVYGLRRISAAIRERDLVVTLDADGEDRPEDLPRLVAPVLRSEPSELAVSLALRTHRTESPLYKLYYLCFRALFRILTGTTVRTGNFIAYRGRVARRTLGHPYFDVCYSSTFLILDIERTFVPCPRGSRYAGESRMNTGKLAIHGLRMLMPFLDRIAIRALGALTTLFVIGLVGALAMAVIALATDWAIPGWAGYAAASLGILALLAIVNSVVLFAVFTQSRAVALGDAGERDD